MRTTCGPNVHVTMDTPLLAVRCYFRHCWTDGLCSEWGGSTSQRGNFHRAVSSPRTKYPHHVARVGAEWGQIASEYENDSFYPGMFSPVSGPGCNCGDPGCSLPPTPLPAPVSAMCGASAWSSAAVGTQ